MSKNRRWTKEEEETLVQAVKANPQNLSLAFKLVAKSLNRTPNAVQFKWYDKVKKDSICFVTISQSKKLKNGKVSTQQSKNTPLKSTKSIWIKIKKLLGF